MYCLSFANLSFFLQFSEGVNSGLTYLLNILLLVILVMSYRKKENQTWIKFVFNKYTAIIAGLGALALIFKIMHYKGADILLISFGALASIYLLVVAFIDPVRKT
jgi:ABC-type arginine transport system permease subunit